MKKFVFATLTIACLAVSLFIFASKTNTLASLLPDAADIPPVQDEPVVAADLYIVEQYENTISKPAFQNIHVESQPYLSEEETLALYQPPISEAINLDALDIPEGCDVSTNLAYERTLFILLNEEREKRGLPLLAWSETLGMAARKHSIDMACSGFFGHTNLDGVPFEDRISAEGYAYYAVGENLYAGDGVFNAPLRAFNGWFYSTRHFNVMTHPALTEVGIGYVYSPNSPHGGYFTADFATPE